jgi:serine phosphatase RsbU (regulator of sigma subunit)
MERANSRLSADLESERFCTAFLAFLAPDGTLEWCSAGHGPILFRSSGDSATQELVPGELPLGVMPELTGDPSPPLMLAPGGLLAVISDGIFEAMNNGSEQFGMERVIELIGLEPKASAPQIIATLRDAATKWTGSEEPTDDQTIVVVRRV